MPYKRSKNTTKPKAKHLGQNTKETPTNKRGRPPKRWSDKIRAELNTPPIMIERRAADKSRWNQFVE